VEGRLGARGASEREAVLLHRLLAGSALPLIGLEDTFAIDGTGFGSSVYDHHFTRKHGKEEQISWSSEVA
jgi:hypothetical protein